MRPLLRHPGIVPSLFSDGIEQDDRPTEPLGVAGRISVALTRWIAILAQDRGDRSAVPSGCVLVGAGLAFLICGRPLFHTARLIIDSPTLR